MESDTSADEPNFTDCETLGTPTTQSHRERRLSVSEMVQRAENRKPKRSAPDRGSKSPRDPVQPAAKRSQAGQPAPAGPPAAEPPAAEPPAMGLSTGALAEIRRMLDSGIAAVISAFERKFDQMERRIQILESEAMEKDLEIRRLGEHLARQISVNGELRTQIESIDLNRRLSSLIPTCDDFGHRSNNENLEDKVINVLQKRIPDLSLTAADIQVVHRLQKDDKVICKFMKRSVRDSIYDARFNLLARDARPGSRGDRKMSPLYINESLTNSNQQLYNQLLQARRSSGGSAIASVFSRRGYVFCRTTKGGPNIRVTDEAALRRLIGGVGAGGVRPVRGGNPLTGKSSGGDAPRSVYARPDCDGGAAVPPDSGVGVTGVAVVSSGGIGATISAGSAVPTGAAADGTPAAAAAGRRPSPSAVPPGDSPSVTVPGPSLADGAAVPLPRAADRSSGEDATRAQLGAGVDPSRSAET